MALIDWLRRRRVTAETYSDMAIQLHSQAALIGASDIGEITAAVQTCVGLWEQGLSLAETEEARFTPFVLALAARQLALTGEALFLVDGRRLVPASEWAVLANASGPTGYRLSLPQTGGSVAYTALPGEVLHFRIGATARAPWQGTPPLRRASLTGGLLHAVESALSDIYADAPIATQIVPMPENKPGANERLASSFRGRRGRVLLRDSVNVLSAGGPGPSGDWKPQDLTPDVDKSKALEAHKAATAAVMLAYGVLPAMASNNATGPVIREAQRHLAQWTLQPLARMMEAEASDKLGHVVSLEVLRPLQAYDAGNRARAASAIIGALATAKQAGITIPDVQAAMQFAGIDQ